MIQIDMSMPEKCEDCFFCGDSCSCVASEYDGLGINVGNAFRTGRRDIRCPLKEQEAVTPTRMNHSEKAGFDNYLCECKNELYYKQKFCDECGRLVKWSE